MRERKNLDTGLGYRGCWQARTHVAMGVVLGMTTVLALYTKVEPVLAQEAAKSEAAPSCQPAPTNAALERQFKDVAPGVPYQSGGVPVEQQGRPQGKAAIVHMVLDQMGFIRRGRDRQAETTHMINRLRFCGSGGMVEDGQTYHVTTYAYGMSLKRDAAREDILTEGPMGKGRLIRVVLGNEAWDESAPGVGTHSADQLAKQRRLQLLRTPFGIAETLTKLDASKVEVHDPGAGRGAVTLELPLDGVPTHVVLDQNYRPATVTQKVGARTIDAQFSDSESVRIDGSQAHGGDNRWASASGSEHR